MSKKADAGTKSRHSLAFGLTLAVATAIAVLTLTPIQAPEVIGKSSDKLYHLLAFTGLTLPISLLAQKYSLHVFGLAIIFAATIEIVQPSIGRSGELGDFFADAAGAVIGLATGLFLGRFRSS